MTDIRDKHDEIAEETDVDLKDFKYYAVGFHVADSLIGKDPGQPEFVVTEEDHESMVDRGFNHLEERYYDLDGRYVFTLAEGDNSLEAHLRRKRTFTVEAIAMKPGEQSYHFPLMNTFDDDRERPEKPVDPIADLKNGVIRHTTKEAVENAGDFQEELEDIKHRYPDFELAEETRKLM